MEINAFIDSAVKPNGSKSDKDIFFTRQRAAKTISLSKNLRDFAFVSKNVMGLGVNNSHLMTEGEVVVSFNEARKQFIWLD